MDYDQVVVMKALSLPPLTVTEWNPVPQTSTTPYRRDMQSEQIASSALPLLWITCIQWNHHAKKDQFSYNITKVFQERKFWKVLSDDF